MKSFLLRKFQPLLILILLLSFQALYAQKTISTATIEFEFVSKGVDGHIGGFKSSSSIDLEQVENSKFKGAVAVKTIKTGMFLRDWHLKGRKYFDEDNYPRIEFESNSISKENNKIIVKGNLTIKGITKSVAINFMHSGNTLTGTTTIFSSDFGINIKKKKEDNKVNVILKLRLN